MKRCFISIDIPENVGKEILKIQNLLPEFYGCSEQSSSVKRRSCAVLKKTELENLHLTLKFLGEISDEKVEEVRKRLKGIDFEKFETEIDLIGVFSERFVRIVWLHLANCKGLQKKVDESLGDLFAREKRFMSHLTIARVKKIENKKYFLEQLERIKIPEIRFEVDRFYLKESVLRPEGAEHRVIEEYRIESKTGFI